MRSARDTSRRSGAWVVLLAVAAVALAWAASAQAAPPVVKVVPWVATNPLVPHDTYPGKTIVLKGTSDVSGANIAWTWDFGDGSPVATGTVSDPYVVEAKHAYTGVAGTVYTARLTIQNTGTGESASKPYYVKMQAKTLSVEVNVAIDEGLWELHREQYRYTYTDPTSHKVSQLGAWDRSRYGGAAYSSYYTVWAANVNAFEVNGHLENGDADNPYVETVARGMRQLFYCLNSSAVSGKTNPLGTYMPDGNGDGKAFYVNQSYPFYQGGLVIDAIVASGTPNALVPAGPAWIDGLKYWEVVQNMVDGYANCQYQGGSLPAYGGGGWRYNCGEWPDNSPSQWAAIGILAALREWGSDAPVPGPVQMNPIVKEWNKVWLRYSGGDNSGRFGYDSPGYYPWGPYAVTPSGMVQMVMDGIGRGDPLWDRAETFMRNNFGNSGGATVAVKDYYYGLFSFVKSLLLHNPPITMLQSATAGVNPIDWYSAEVSRGDPTDGVARVLVNDQNTTWGYWYGHNYEGNQYRLETATAIIMLNRTVFSGGAPVAVGVATPNPAVAGSTVTLDGTGSFHQDAAKSIVKWEWDLDNNGTFETLGVIVTKAWPALGSYPVRLRVTDNAATPATAESTLTVIVSIPPLAPTANAGGPYNFCPAAKPWFLDGSKSVNPDEGQSEPGKPADTIFGLPSQFSWNLGNAFGDAEGTRPNVTTYFEGKGTGSYLVNLRVTDTTATSFPSSGQPNLTSTSSAQVFVLSATDPKCATCVTNLRAIAKSQLVQLTWTLAGADHYNVYRSTLSGGPYLKVGTATGTQTVYFDRGLVNGTTYYYVVRSATLGETEICQSVQVSARPIGLR